MNSDENKDTLSSSPSIFGEFAVNTQISANDAIDSTSSGAPTGKLFSDYGFDIVKVARLANLIISDNEKEVFSNQLRKILFYIRKLNEVDTENVEPTFNVTGLSNVMAEDESKPSLTQDEALANSSDKKDGMFVTKGVFEETTNDQ